MTGEQLKKIVYSRLVIKNIASDNADKYQRLTEHLQSREAKLQKVKKI
jgi:hypothetical protein